MSHSAFSQIIELDNKKLTSLPRFYNNKEFVALVEKQCKELVYNRVDSILVYYTINFPSNFAVLVWKKDQLSNCIAFYQSDYKYYPVGKMYIKNDTLKDVNIESIYKVFNNDEVRTIDSNFFAFDDNPVYCQFYSGHKTEIKAAYWTLTGRVDRAFYSAYMEERHKIFKRESQ